MKTNEQQNDERNEKDADVFEDNVVVLAGQSSASLNFRAAASLARHMGVLAFACVGFAGRGRSHKLQDAGAGVDLCRVLGLVRLVSLGHGLFLRVGELLVSAEHRDLLPLALELRGLGAALQQVQRLAVLLWKKVIYWMRTGDGWYLRDK